MKLKNVLADFPLLYCWAIFFAIIYSQISYATERVPMVPSVAAKAYLLQDYQTGKIIAGENIHQRLAPASITKLMTAYVVSNELAMGNITLDEEVLISEKAWRMVGSRSFIEVNSRVKIEDLLRGMIIQSGNDAAVALAEHIAGGEAIFAQMMNQYAVKLGMHDTHYTNVTGLPDPNHYTTAKDIATLSTAVIRDFPVHYRWYSEKEYTYNNITQRNRNKLLWRDKSVDGLKTGLTNEAGYCLVASANRDGMRLISVILGAKSPRIRTKETQKLLNYGFRFYTTQTLYDVDETILEAKVWKGSQKTVSLGVSAPLVLTLARGDHQQLVYKKNHDVTIVAPFSAGQQLGMLEVYLNDELLAEQAMVAIHPVEANHWWGRFIDSVNMLFED